MRDHRDPIYPSFGLTRPVASLTHGPSGIDEMAGVRARFLIRRMGKSSWPRGPAGPLGWNIVHPLTGAFNLLWLEFLIPDCKS